MRSNTWLIHAEDRGIPLGDDVVQTLSLANPLKGIQEFHTDLGTLRTLFSLYHWSSGYGSSARKTLALLINHHARIIGDSCRDFGNSVEQEPVDRFGVGSTAPRLWVLGVQGNTRAKSHPLPFGTTAGTALLWPHVRPWSTRISNCLEPHEKPDEARRRLRHEWEQLGRPQVLLLGNVASSMWSSQVSHFVIGFLEHPQFIYRFHHGMTAEWSAQFQRFQDEAG